MNIDAPIGKWIAKLYKDHDQFVDNLLEKFNLNHSEGNLLVYLYKDGDGKSQKELEENLGVDKATISRSIYTLIEKGFLKKRKSPEDGRVNLIYLTENAFDIQKEINNIYQQWFQEFSAEIEKKEAEQILETLEKMYKIVQNRDR